MRPAESRNRTQNDADGGLGPGRQIVIDPFIGLQLPDQIVVEIVEPNLDPAVPIEREVAGNFLDSFVQSRSSLFEFRGLSRFQFAGALRLFEEMQFSDEFQRFEFCPVVEKQIGKILDHLHQAAIGLRLADR